MADEKKSKATKNKRSIKDKKRLGISALAVIDNMVFSKTDQWAYYRITNDVYDFLSNSQKVQKGLQIANAFNNLMNERQESLDCHLVVTSVPVDVDAWAHQIKTISSDWNQGPGFNTYVNEQIQYLKNEEFLKKVVYLGVHIGKRGALDFGSVNVLENGVKSALETVQSWMSAALQAPTEVVSATEEDDARKKEAKLNNTLAQGHLGAERCSSEEILLLIKRQFYPSMAAPYLDVDHENRLGPGDLDLELHSAIENRYRWLKFNQMLGSEEVSGYRACLSFSKFPKFQDYPNQGFPFFYFPSKMSLPFTCYSRFTLHPSKKMKLELEKKKKEQEDEIINMEAGQNNMDRTRGLPTDVAQALHDTSTIEHLLAEDKAPWVEGSYRIVVETPTEELLKKYCSIIKQSYTDLDINVSWTSGDQAELFLEQMPGDRLRMSAFDQISNITMLATSGFNFSSDVGDPIFGNDGQVTI